RLVKQNKEGRIQGIKEVNKKIQKISKKCYLEIQVEFGDKKSTSEVDRKIKKLKKYYKTIYKVQKVENELVHKQNIEKHIEKR
ncbi:15055_t:CDS:1, partial [Gigaspora margarita]